MGQNMGPPSDPMSASQVRRVSLLSPAELTAQLAAEAAAVVATTHWEELLDSVSDFIFSNHCGYTPRGVKGVKRPEIL